MPETDIRRLVLAEDVVAISTLPVSWPVPCADRKAIGLTTALEEAKISASATCVAAKTIPNFHAQK